MNWSPPQFFTDNSPLVPATDLSLFEIYIKQDFLFGPADNPVATTSPTTTFFDYRTLVPPLSKGVTYYASVRAVTMDGVKSDFSAYVAFTLP